MANNKQIELNNNNKKICLLVGYITKKAIEVDNNYNHILKDKIIKNVEFFDKQTLNKIYVNSIKLLTLNDAVDESLNMIMEYLSYLMIIAENEQESLTKYDTTYYYTLGLTASKLSVQDNNIVIADNIKVL